MTRKLGFSKFNSHSSTSDRGLAHAVISDDRGPTAIGNNFADDRGPTIIATQ